MSPLAFKQQLERRTKDFATTTFKVIDQLPSKVSTRVISFQLGKSASSVGANYREANRAESHDDFKHKVSIVLKEANESLYWLDILSDLYPQHESIQNLAEECTELVKLFQSISRSTRKTVRQ